MVFLNVFDPDININDITILQDYWKSREFLDEYCTIISVKAEYYRATQNFKKWMDELNNLSPCNKITLISHLTFLDPQCKSMELHYRYADPCYKSSFALRVLHRYLNTKKYLEACLLYTSPSPRDATLSRMPSSA